MVVVVNWNGKEVPEEMRAQPKDGTSCNRSTTGVLTPEEEEGLEQAARELDADESFTADEVRARLEGILRR